MHIFIPKVNYKHNPSGILHSASLLISWRYTNDCNSLVCSKSQHLNHWSQISPEDANLKRMKAKLYIAQQYESTDDGMYIVKSSLPTQRTTAIDFLSSILPHLCTNQWSTVIIIVSREWLVISANFSLSCRKPSIHRLDLWAWWNSWYSSCTVRRPFVAVPGPSAFLILFCWSLGTTTSALCVGARHVCWGRSWWCWYWDNYCGYIGSEILLVC